MQHELAIRIAVLFTLGVGLSLLFNLLLMEHHVYTLTSKYPTYFGSVWWLPLWAGLAVVLVGLGAPYSDMKLGEEHTLNREWPSVVRCFGLLIGLFYACAKLPNVTNVQLSLLISFLAVFVWWVFDRSRQGFTLSLLFAILGTMAVQGLVFIDIMRYTQPDFLLVRSWILPMLFTAGVAFGSVGRQLAIATGAYFPAESGVRTTAAPKQKPRAKAD